MPEAKIREYAKTKGFHPQTVARWLNLAPADSAALYRLAFGLKIGENHLRDIMGWLEEIALRDQSPIERLLADRTITEIETDPRLGRADKLKRIKEQVRRWRFPRLAETEDAIYARIQELKLSPEIRLTLPPGLEGGRVQVEFAASSQDELQRLVAKLAEAKEKDAVREIFDLLAGRIPQAE
jgi:hypothetical protein